MTVTAGTETTVPQHLDRPPTAPEQVLDPLTGDDTGWVAFYIPDTPTPNEPTWDDVLGFQRTGLWETVEEEWDSGVSMVVLAPIPGKVN